MGSRWRSIGTATGGYGHHHRDTRGVCRSNPRCLPRNTDTRRLDAAGCLDGVALRARRRGRPRVRPAIVGRDHPRRFGNHRRLARARVHSWCDGYPDRHSPAAPRWRGPATGGRREVARLETRTRFHSDFTCGSCAGPSSRSSTTPNTKCGFIDEPNAGDVSKRHDEHPAGGRRRPRFPLATELLLAVSAGEWWRRGRRRIALSAGACQPFSDRSRSLSSIASHASR